MITNTLAPPPLSFLTAFTRCIEMFGESIPSSVLLTYSLLGLDAISKTVVFSIFISACTIAFASTTISVDFDIDPVKRKFAPSFYGFMPDKNRNLVFLLMMLMTGAHVLMKVLACSLMLRLNQTMFVLYMGGDMYLYFCYKMLRDDFRYWLKIDSQILSWIVSVLQRFLIKSVTDVTLIAQFRHPFELGGVYWAVNVVLNQLFCFTSVYLYVKYSEDANETIVQGLSILVSFLFVFSMLNFLGFLSLIDSKYRRTFFDTQTGKSFAVSNFHEAETDSTKFEIFGHHRSYYHKIEGELKVWLVSDWQVWMDDKPDWFEAAAVASVPSDLLPAPALILRQESNTKVKAEEKKAKEKGNKVKVKVKVGAVVPEGE